MRSRLAPLALALPLAACTTVAEPISEQLPAEGVRRVVMDVEQGSLRYQGRDRADAVLVGGQAWGQASQEERAQERLDGTDWHADRDGDAVIAIGYALSGMAGVDFDLAGPARVDVTLETGDGSASLDSVVGHHVVVADRIDAWNVAGSAELHATAGGVTATLAPGPGDVIRVSADGGDVVLELPWGLAYDLQVWGDPEYPMTVHDLGFQFVAEDAGYFAAIAGPGTTRVDVVVTGGAVDIRPVGAW